MKPWICFIKRNGQLVSYNLFYTRKDAREFSKVVNARSTLTVEFKTIITRNLSSLAKRLKALVMTAKQAVCAAASHTGFAKKISKALTVAKSLVVEAKDSIKNSDSDRPMPPLPLFLQKHAA